MKRFRIGNGDDRGASLVEFAMIMPFLLLLILGIVEFGFLMGEWNGVKHGAHEGARLAAVDDASLLANTCNAMDLHSPSTTITVTFNEITGDELGDQAEVTVTASNLSSLSGLGFIEVFLPTSISADADFRLEQASSWGPTLTGTC